MSKSKSKYFVMAQAKGVNWITTGHGWGSLPSAIRFVEKMRQEGPYRNLRFRIRDRKKQLVQQWDPVQPWRAAEPEKSGA